MIILGILWVRTKNSERLMCEKDTLGKNTTDVIMKWVLAGK